MPAPAHDRVEAGFLILLDVEEDDVAPRFGGGDGKPPQNVGLYQVQSAHEKSTEPKREGDSARLVAGPIEVRDALPYDVGPTRAQTLSRCPREQCSARRQSQNCHTGCRAHAKCLSDRPRARKRDADDAQHHRRVDEQPGRVGPAHAQDVGVGIASQGLQWGHIAQCEEGTKREYQRDSSAHRQAGKDRRRDKRHVNVYRQKIGEYVGQEELDHNSQRGTSGGAGNPHRRRLRNVDRQHLATGSPETAQHGDSVDLALDERPHAARDPDSSEQERHQTDDADEIGKILDRVGGADLGLGHGAQQDLLIRRALSERLHELVGINPGRQLGNDRSVGGAAEDQQLGLGDVFCWNEDARSQHLGDACRAGDVLDRRDDGKGPEAELERVSHLCVERGEQRRIDYRIGALPQHLPAAGGLGDDVAVERIVVGDAANLREASARCAGHHCHRWERRNPGQRNTPVRQRVEQRIESWRKRF